MNLETHLLFNPSTPKSDKNKKIIQEKSQN